MRPIEKRIVAAETARDEARQANARTLQANAHLSRPELEALVRAKVADFLSCRTMAHARHLCRDSKVTLQVLDIIERENAHANP